MKFDVETIPSLPKPIREVFTPTLTTLILLWEETYNLWMMMMIII